MENILLMVKGHGHVTATTVITVIYYLICICELGNVIYTSFRTNNMCYYVHHNGPWYCIFILYIGKYYLLKKK